MIAPQAVLKEALFHALSSPTPQTAFTYTLYAVFAVSSVIWKVGVPEMFSAIPSVSTSNPAGPYLRTQAVSDPPASQVMSADEVVILSATRLFTFEQVGAAPGV